MGTSRTKPPPEPIPRPEAAPPEPRPWLTPEDARGWQPLGRVRTPDGGPPRARVTVEFDAAQSAWLDTEAERVGLTLEAFLARLVDQARGAA